MKSIFTLLFLMLFGFTNNLQAQNSESEKNPESEKSFVSVPVTVSDREGHYIAGLKKEDFIVFQDGVKQKITFFSKFNEPLKIVILLDTSKSIRDVIKKVKNAAKDFAGSLNSNDQCQVATFDSQVKILNSFTSNQKLIKSSLDKVKVNDYGGTQMYSAVNQIINKSFNDSKGRKVIILLTDGNDFGSPISKEDFLGQLEESDILIYTIFFKTGRDLDKQTKKEQNAQNRKKKKEKPDNNNAQVVYVPTEAEMERLERNEELEAIDSLKKMSDITAGRYFFSDAANLKTVFKNITGELSQQYRLGYVSKDVEKNTDTHNIIVKVDRPDVVVRTRGTFRTKKF